MSLDLNNEEVFSYGNFGGRIWGVFRKFRRGIGLVCLRIRKNNMIVGL